MAQISLNTEQQAQLQAEVQRELERREWAEPGDNVMAEYITVLLANGNTKERVQTEMDDLVGSDFDARFLDWLFDSAQTITAPPPAADPPTASRSPPAGPAARQASGGGRLLSNALAASSHQQPEKRKLDDRQDQPQPAAGNKRRIPEGLPSGPRGMSGEGRSLADRMGPRSGAGAGRGGFQVRGMAGGRGGFGGGFQPHGQGQGFRPGPGMAQPGFNGFFPPGQQEMMAQMMMMQANMAQMNEMMQKMAEEREAAQARAAAASAPARPVRPAPARIPHGTKLGSHSVSVVPPKRASSPGPIPDKPSSKTLCRFSVGCSNSRCPFSHPSPVADEKTGMVLSEEACEAGRECKDAECVKSHVSPAAVHGGAAGPSRMLCKYQNCTNPSCQFRHEDADGNPIPPPALAAGKAAKEARAAGPGPAVDHVMSDNDDGDVEVVMSSKSLMDGPLSDAKAERPCRYGERCTRADCKFSHPASRPTPRGAQGAFGKQPPAGNGAIAGNGMNVSKKFGVVPEKKLDPTVGEFKPAAAGV